MSNARVEEVAINELGHRGDGIVRAASGPIYVAGALPGESVLARIEGERGQLLDVIEASPDRIASICPYFGDCGGCATQHLAPRLYASWKRDMLAAALAQAHVAAPLGALIDAHGEGRRRATFHARLAAGSASVEIGFMRARAHQIVEIEFCPILAPSMAGALGAARALAEGLRGLGKPLDINVTATLSGLDFDIRGCGALDPSARRKLIETADRLDLARLANHGEVVVERRPPQVMMGAARVSPPAGGFLQATLEGERVLAELALGAMRGGRRVADLFSGAGAFALRLAADHDVHAVEIDHAALGALARGAAATPELRPVTCEQRDLFRRPLRPDELSRFDAVVFDPPRAGAEAQSRQLAASIVPTVVAISCNAASFARDMHILVAGGYEIQSIAPIDQFRFAPHIEIVGVLQRPAASGVVRITRARRLRAKGLLG